MNDKKRFYKIPNGDFFTTVYECDCDDCGGYIHESHPHWEDEDAGEILCWDCAFKHGYISDKEYLNSHGIYLSHARAEYHDGEIYVILKGKFPWEKTANDIRHSEDYIEWRSAVFERDNYTCVICNQVGGQLEAHHIKPFSKYHDVRFDINNGITLCKKCHRKVHKDKDEKWLHID